MDPDLSPMLHGREETREQALGAIGPNPTDQAK